MSNTFKQQPYRDATMTLTNTFSKSTLRVTGDADASDSLCIGLWGNAEGNNSYGYIQVLLDSGLQSRELFLSPNLNAVSTSIGGAVGIGNTNPLGKLHISGGVQNNSSVNANITPINPNIPPVLFLDATNQFLGTTKGNFMPIMTLGSTVSNNSYLNLYNYRHASSNTWQNAGTRIQHTIDFSNLGYIEFNPPGTVGGIGLYGNNSTNLNASSKGITVSTTGFVGIGGATTPAAYLHVLPPTGTTGQTSAIIPGANNAIIANAWPSGWYGGLSSWDITCSSFCSGTTVYSSDVHRKTNIETYKRGVSEVMKLRPVSFIWKESPNKGIHIGFIAQELEQIIPELILEDAGGLKGIKQGIEAILVNCIQEQRNAIKILQTENQYARSQLSSILSILADLENK